MYAKNNYMKKTGIKETQAEAQKRIISEVTDKWLTETLAAKPYNKPLIEETMKCFFTPHPIMHYTESPLEAQNIASAIYDCNRVWTDKVLGELENRIYLLPAIQTSQQSYMWDVCRRAGNTKRLLASLIETAYTKEHGHYDPTINDHSTAHWLAYYESCYKMGHIYKKDDRIERYGNYLLNSGVFFTIIKGAHVIVSPLPVFIKVDSNGQLHCPDGPAVAWDGLPFFFLNNINIPESYLDLSSENKQDLVLLLKERNVEVRKEIVNRLGIDALTRGLGAKSIDKYYDYELFSIELPGFRRPLTYLKMSNPSLSNTWHVEAVPPEIKTCQQALAWRDSDKEGIYIVPDILT